MIDSILVVLLILLIVLIFYGYVVNNNSESFDTYRNHDFGALEVYKDSNIEVANQPIKNVDQAELYAKYDWSERDRAGYTVYDRMYDNVTAEKIWDVNEEPNITLGTYDSKFSLMDNTNDMSRYNLYDMADKNYIQTQVNGQTITLSQKQY